MLLDEKDILLMSYLQDDCKQTNKALALKLDLSITAVFERIRKLEKNGYIDKYVALINKKKAEKSFIAFCHVKLTQHSQDFVIKFETNVIKLNEVLECYHLSGDYDYLLKVVVDSMETYRDFIVHKLTKIENIGSTRSMFMINEVKYTTAISIN